MNGKAPAPIPQFRRSLFGYSARDVDRFLSDTAADRDRLRDALARVESLMAEWQHSADAIPSVAPQTTKTEAKPNTSAPRDVKASESRMPLVLPRWEVPATLEPGISTLRTGDGWLSEDPFTDEDGPSRVDASVTREPLTAFKALELSRSNRARHRRRIFGLVTACAAIAAAILMTEFRAPGPASSSGNIDAQAVVAAPVAPAPAKTPDRSGSTAPVPAQSSREVQVPSVTPPGTLMLTISAVKECWMRTVVDGSQPMERTLKAGETVMLHATNEVLLRVGDAGAISLMINNRATKPLGGSGEVITRHITRANYSSLLRTE